jgi:hypothetical protein
MRRLSVMSFAQRYPARVAPITGILSGHRITPTYDLYIEADDDGALLVPAKD